MALWRPISSVTAPPAHIALRANLPCMVLTHKLWPASTYPAMLLSAQRRTSNSLPRGLLSITSTAREPTAESGQLREV